MIFVIVGSQRFQFNRLLKKVDELVEQNVISSEVFAQIGVSDYIPNNYQYKDFIDRFEFQSYMEKADIVITHGGTGSIINAVKKQKKIIAVPRLENYGEHVDNHQIQVVSEFDKVGFVTMCSDIQRLSLCIDEVRMKKCPIYISNTKALIESINDFIGGSK